MQNLTKGMAFLGLFVAFGMAVGGYFISQVMINAKTGVNTASVKGLSEKLVEADRVSWYIEFTLSEETLSDIDHKTLYQQASTNQKKIINILQSIGFTKDDYKADPIEYDVYNHRNDNRELTTRIHVMSGSININSQKLSLVDPAREQVSELIQQGIKINMENPQYTFTNLNDIKPQMLREATENARIAANEFAKNAGVKVGGIQYAHYGRFQIRDANNNNTQNHDSMKRVRVVTTISFYLVN